jgi:hypothetical protein
MWLKQRLAAPRSTCCPMCGLYIAEYDLHWDWHRRIRDLGAGRPKVEEQSARRLVDQAIER